MRALRRAAGLLILVSVVRWGWGQRGGAHVDRAKTILPELVAESRAVAAEEERRTAPLGEGERVDLNRAVEVELDRLPGVGPSTARAIVAAREAGVVFRTPEDLLIVSGIGPATLERIRGRASVEDPPRGGGRPTSGPGGGGREPGSLVDLNRAGTEALQTLPGIGPALAERIVSARKEHMFTSLDDLQRVRGVGPVTVDRIRSFATVGP